MEFPENFPVQLFDKICLYNIHPVAEIFKEKCKCLIKDAMEGEEEDENFYYQWIDVKEQNKYRKEMEDTDSAIDYCNYCNKLVILYQGSLGCSICGEPP